MDLLEWRSHCEEGQETKEPILVDVPLILDKYCLCDEVGM